MKKGLDGKVSDEVLYKIADNIVEQFMEFEYKRRPKSIHLHNANASELTKIMLRIYEGLKQRRVKRIQVFIGSDEEYSVNVGKIVSTYQSTS